jgi:plastocyanin
MRKAKGRAAAAQGLLTALLVVAGMMVVAYATVALSDSQQFPAQQSESAGNQASGSNAGETSLPLANQTNAQPGAPSPATTFVKILLGSADSVSYSFSPLEVTVVIGVNNTVNWVNDDNAAHTVTAKDGSFSSGNMASGSSYTYTFTTPGTFTYYCAYHSWMVGTVVVKAG